MVVNKNQVLLLNGGSPESSLWYVKPEIRAQRGKSCDGREIIKQLSDGKFLTLDRIHYCHYMIPYQQPTQKPFFETIRLNKKGAIKNRGLVQ